MPYQEKCYVKVWDGGRIDNVSLEEMIIVDLVKGLGTPESPCRIVKCFYKKDGTFVFELDSWKIEHDKEVCKHD